MTDERELLEAARVGDEKAFALLIGPYQAQLRTHCYRMLGSLHDADDALQETMLRAWSGLDGFESRSSLRSWLYRIATYASLRMIEKRPKRVLPIDYGPAADPHVAFGEPLTESIWLEPYPDAQLGLEASMLGPDARYEQRESIELAFAAAFQHLPARQRAVLILRDVLGFSARETADALEMTPVSVDSALQRAHKAIEQRVPGRTQQATLRGLGDSELRQIVTRFADAWERHDVDAVVAMLTDDARMTMPPWPSWYRGRDAIATFLRSWPLAHRKRWQLLHTGANGQPAVAGYLWDEQRAASDRKPSSCSPSGPRGSCRSPPSARPNFSRASACPSNSLTPRAEEVVDKANERRTEMGTIVVSENVSLDGVIQDPAGDEGFRVGGWVGLIKDSPQLNKLALDEALDAEALLLGRRSYEWFAARWPSRSGALADRLNSLPKYVVSSTLEDPAWNNSTVLKGDPVAEVSKLKQELRGGILVPASFQLVRALIEQDLVDELRLKIFPVVLGAGKRLFGETSDKKPMRLVDTQTAGDGVAVLTYVAVRPAS